MEDLFFLRKQIYIKHNNESKLVATIDSFHAQYHTIERLKQEEHFRLNGSETIIMNIIQVNPKQYNFKSRNEEYKRY